MEKVLCKSGRITRHNQKMIKAGTVFRSLSEKATVAGKQLPASSNLPKENNNQTAKSMIKNKWESNLGHSRKNEQSPCYTL